MRSEIYATFLGKRLCLLHRDRREIDGEDIKALLGQPDAVAAFAISDCQGTLTRDEQLFLSGEECIRLRPEEIILAGKSLIPTQQVLAHRSIIHVFTFRVGACLVGDLVDG